MVKKLTPINEKLSHAQTKKACDVCGKGGRTLATFGKIQMNYCGKHRKYGEEVIDFFIDSMIDDKLTTLRRSVKTDILMTDFPKLSEESYRVIAEYVHTKIVEIDEIKKWLNKKK